MASTFIERRTTSAGARWIVRYRLGGRESAKRYAGSFRTLREARLRRDAIAADLAALRVPDVKALARAPVTPTTACVCQAWAESRLDVAEGTRTLHRVSLARILPYLGAVPVDELTPAAVAAAIAALHGAGYKRGSIQKSLTALRMALDHAGLEPNPARDRRVKLPREAKREVQPPTRPTSRRRSAPSPPAIAFPCSSSRRRQCGWASSRP